MFHFPRRTKLIVPNSLALFAAAILVWSTAGTTDAEDDQLSACNRQGQQSAMPEMTASPPSCVSESDGGELLLQVQDKALASAQSVGFDLLYLSAKTLINP